MRKYFRDVSIGMMFAIENGREGEATAYIRTGLERDNSGNPCNASRLFGKAKKLFDETQPVIILH